MTGYALHVRAASVHSVLLSLSAAYAPPGTWRGFGAATGSEGTAGTGGGAGLHSLGGLGGLGGLGAGADGRYPVLPLPALERLQVKG